MKIKDRTLKTFTPNLQEFYDILYYSNDQNVGDVFTRFADISFHNLKDDEADINVIQQCARISFDFPEYGSIEKQRHRQGFRVNWRKQHNERPV